MRLGNPGLAIDSKLEEEGKWIDCPNIWWKDKDHPMRLLLRGASTRKYQATLRKTTKDNTPEELEEKAYDINAELGTELVAGWQNVYDGEGNEVIFSVDVCRGVLRNRDNRRLLDFIHRMASDVSTFNAKRAEEVEKN